MKKILLGILLASICSLPAGEALAQHRKKAPYKKPLIHRRTTQRTVHQNYGQADPLSQPVPQTHLNMPDPPKKRKRVVIVPAPPPPGNINPAIPPR